MTILETISTKAKVPPEQTKRVLNALSNLDDDRVTNALIEGLNRSSWFCEYEGEWHNNWTPSNGLPAAIRFILSNPA